MTAICFWFLVTCQYFKRGFYSKKTPEELFDELIARINAKELVVD
jgi:hypothetical protein